MRRWIRARRVARHSGGRRSAAARDRRERRGARRSACTSSPSSGEADRDLARLSAHQGQLGPDRPHGARRCATPSVDRAGHRRPVRRPDLRRIRPDLGFFIEPAAHRARRRWRAATIACSAASCASSRARASRCRGAHRGGAGRCWSGEGRSARCRPRRTRWPTSRCGFDVVRALGAVRRRPGGGGRRTAHVAGHRGRREHRRHAGSASPCSGGCPRAVSVRVAACSSSGPKPGQELRVDMPAIGPRHRRARGSKPDCAGVAVLARGVIALERAELVRSADAGGMLRAGRRRPRRRHRRRIAVRLRAAVRQVIGDAPSRRDASDHRCGARRGAAACLEAVSRQRRQPSSTAATCWPSSAARGSLRSSLERAASLRQWGAPALGAALRRAPSCPRTSPPDLASRHCSPRPRRSSPASPCSAHADALAPTSIELADRHGLFLVAAPTEARHEPSPIAPRPRDRRRPAASARAVPPPAATTCASSSSPASIRAMRSAAS